MAKEIVKYPNSILNKKSERIGQITEEVERLGQEMVRVLIENQGIGLAAPQIGELKRLIVVEKEKGTEIFVNPEIIKKSSEIEIGEEGCLSFPEVFLKIKRAKEIEVKAFNLKGEELKIKAKGLPARIFQHEIDHLNGVLFIKRVGLWQRFKIRSKLK